MFSIEYVYTNIMSGRQATLSQEGSSVKFNGLGWFYRYGEAEDGSAMEGQLYAYPEGIDALVADVRWNEHVSCVRYSKETGQLDVCVVAEVWRLKSVNSEELQALFRIKGDALRTNTGRPVELSRYDLLEALMIRN